ncbi:MAG: hypothetical protein FWB75_00580 [Oscillospiraceae bacterium]|nr:hypothetical protein [Oscillospiraceae bacterium]
MLKIKKTYKTCAALLFAVVMALAVTACSNDVAELPLAEDPARAVADADYVSDAVVYEEPEVNEFYETVMGFVSAQAESFGMVTGDSSVTFEIGLEGSQPLTFEFLMELVEDFIWAEIEGMPIEFPEFEEFIAEHSLRFRVESSSDENWNMAFNFSMPSQAGGYVDLLDIIFVDNVIYISMAPILDIADFLIDIAFELFLFDMLEAQGLDVQDASIELDELLTTISVLSEFGFLPPEVADILGAVEILFQMEYLAIDLNDIPDMEFFEEMMEASLDFYEPFIAFSEDLVLVFAQQSLLDLVEELDIISRDGGWYVLEFDEVQAGLLLEEIFRIAYEYAVAVTYIFNQIIELYADMGIMPVYEIAPSDLREGLEFFDPSFFDEFTALVSYKVRADGGTQESVFSIAITPEELDDTIVISMYTEVSPRAGLITAPAGAVTSVDEILLEFLGIGLADLVDMNMGFVDVMAPVAVFDMSDFENAGHAQVLVGTWHWDLDDGYTYVFEADGVVTRGFEGTPETLEWGTIDNQLIMIGDSAWGPEIWAFEVVGDVLTITSEQVAGISFSYIRAS